MRCSRNPSRAAALTKAQIAIPTVALLIALATGVAGCAEGSRPENQRGIVQSKDYVSRTTTAKWQSQLVKLANKTPISPQVLTRQLALLGSPSRPMPLQLRHRAVRNLGGRQELGLDFATAHYAQTSANVGLWVVKGSGIVCLFEAKVAASTCVTAVSAIKHGVELIVSAGPGKGSPSAPHQFFAFGLEPNHVEAVRLGILTKGPGGPPLRIPVRANVFGVRLDNPAQVIEKIQR